jgi:hypothetical protein
MEMRTSAGARIDLLFQPKKDKSTIAIFFELKKVEGLGNEIKHIEKAFYQMFDKNVLIIC